MDTGCSPVDLKGPGVSLGIKPEMVTKKLNPYASVKVLGMGVEPTLALLRTGF